MDTQTLWKTYGDNLYFFILKRTKDRAKAQDIFQNTFLKAHTHIGDLRDEGSAKSWLFRIARNELADFSKAEGKYAPIIKPQKEETAEYEDAFCCFDRFLDQLPKDYYLPVHLVYVEGKKQAEAAEILGIGLPNLKARLRRAKETLKTNFQKCCHYELNERGQLVGEANCGHCK